MLRPTTFRTEPSKG